MDEYSRLTGDEYVALLLDIPNNDPDFEKLQKAVFNNENQLKALQAKSELKLLGLDEANAESQSEEPNAESQSEEPNAESQSQESNDSSQYHPTNWISLEIVPSDEVKTINLGKPSN
jgi:hypothetical protein